MNIKNRQEKLKNQISGYYDLCRKSKHCKIVIAASPTPQSASAIRILLYEFLNNLFARTAPAIEPAAPIVKSVA